MAKNLVFYKGRRRKRNYALIPFVILVCVVAIVVVLFYGMQQYAVITKDGVAVKLKILDEEKTMVDEQGNIVKVFDKVDASLSFKEADYSGVEAVAGKNVDPLKAIFVPHTDLNEEKLLEYQGRLKSGNALVLEMKPRSGNLMWESQSYVARNYGLTVANETTAAMPRLIQMLKEKNVYLVAQISCCIDELLASRSTQMTLRTITGSNYRDENGTWLDPYNENVRSYAVEMAEELFALGFDEVVLADVMHPILPEETEVVYTREMSTDPSPVNAVCGFALYVAENLSDRDGVLSIYCNTAFALVKPETKVGQDAPLFMKLYDRVYLPTDKFAYSYNLADIEKNVKIGKASVRFVPVVENYLPESDSWVLIDVPEEEED